MTENGEHVVDGVHRPSSASTPVPVDAVTRVDMQRARQAASGAEVHPDAALLAARLARVVTDPGARPVAVPAGPGAVGPGVGGPAVPAPGATGPGMPPTGVVGTGGVTPAGRAPGVGGPGVALPGGVGPGRPGTIPGLVAPHGVGPNGLTPNGLTPNGAAPHGPGPHGPGPHPAAPNGVGPLPAGPHHAAPHATGPHGDSDDGTVKITAPHGAPARPHPRPSPRPRGLTPHGGPGGLGAPGAPGVLGVSGALGGPGLPGAPTAPGTPSGPGALSVVEGPASVTTKAPAAVPVGLAAAPVLIADPVDPAPRESGPREAAAVRVPPGVREAAFAAAAAPPRASAGTPQASFPPSVPPGVLGVVALPAAPALVCDAADRIVQVNAALLRLAGRTDADVDGGLHGKRLAQLVVGPDADARLVRADGALVRVRVVRWPVGRDRQVVVFVEILDAYAAELERTGDRRWTAELERMARVGTWRYELATGTLHRSESLQELYRRTGVEPDGSGGPVEGEQVALLVRSLRTGAPTADHRAELALPGVRLSCRAEVELGADGTPVRLTGVVRDVTAQHETETRARHASRRFADLAALVPTGVAIIDPDGQIREANPALGALLDVAPERLRGLPVAALSAEPVPDPGTTALDGPLPPRLPEWLRPVAPGAAHAYRVDAAPLLRGDGTTVWCELAVSATTLDDDGWLWLLAATDTSEQRRAAELLRSAGTVDELTRLPNRAATLELLGRLLARPGAERVAVVCGDVDDFQRVNSSLGHEAGDDLLVTLAGRLQRELPVGCTAARFAADEFVVVCDDLDEAGGPDALAATVGDLLRTTVAVRGRTVQLTASIGLAVPKPGTEVGAADLLRFAEIAMHDAKRTCRGGFAVATDRVLAATHALELEAELRSAIATDGLVLEYQPVVGPDGLVTTAEALVRWPHPEHGVISPAEFLPVAQRGGMLRELDEWVLRTATREAATWPEHGGRPVAVAVNLAGLLPGDAAFRATVTDIVEAAGLPWDRLVLEVVETSLVALPPHAVAAMDRLVACGVRFAVDDFGTGYSSLARLKELPAQIIKVDRAFVTGVGTDPADFAVARAVVDMAKAMGRSTVAEGVETTEQYHVLRGVGVDAFQGWLFARPLPAWQLRDVLAGGRVAVPTTATST